MTRTISEHIKRCNTDNRINHILIRNRQGDRAFCAGGDVKELAKAMNAKQDAKVQEFFTVEYNINVQLAESRKKIIALMDGITSN